MKISDYFVHFDMNLSEKLVEQYILPTLNNETITSGFIHNVLRYMNLLENEETVRIFIILGSETKSCINKCKFWI